MSNNTTDSSLDVHSLKLVVPALIIYSIIFVVGCFGNITTCIVIVRNKFMHTATNCYLLSLAISDLLMILFDLGPWILETVLPDTTQQRFKLGVCVMLAYVPGFAMHVSILTITAFTIERYIAICHPFMAHKLSGIPRVKKYILGIWVAAAAIAVPQMFGYAKHCHLKYNFVSAILPFVKYSYIVNLVLIFFGPLILISVLYILIGLKLKQEDKLQSNSVIEQKKIVKMLVVVVVSFFICWGPFQCCRFYYICFVMTGTYDELLQHFTSKAYMAYVCGGFYFLSTAINPILYNLMSNKFRKAFKITFLRKQPDKLMPAQTKPNTTNKKPV